MSPKFVIGESYGTTRASGLAGYLLGRHQIYLNGVILVSMTNLSMERGPDVSFATGAIGSGTHVKPLVPNIFPNHRWRA